MWRQISILIDFLFGLSGLIVALIGAVNGDYSMAACGWCMAIYFKIEGKGKAIE